MGRLLRTPARGEAGMRAGRRFVGREVSIRLHALKDRCGPGFGVCAQESGARRHRFRKGNPGGSASLSASCGIVRENLEESWHVA